MRCTSKVGIACMVLLGSLAAAAQTPATGIYPFGSFDNKGFDTINRGNLNVHFEIPIISKRGRGGANFSYSLIYDSLIWNSSSVSGSSLWYPSANWGWNNSTNAEYGYVTYNEQTIPCTERNGQRSYIQLFNDYKYHDARGRSGNFPANYRSPCGGGIPTGTATYGSSDNTGYTIYDVNNTFTIFTQYGEQFAVQAYAGIDGGTPQVTGGPGVFTDTNGNEVSADSNGNFTDTTGKTVLTISGSGTASSPMVYKYTDSNGSSQTVTVHYTNYNIKTNFGSGTGAYSQNGVPLVSSIVYSADGSSYAFAYEATPGESGYYTGRISSITLRTGGTIDYAYAGGNNGIEPDGTTAELKRTTTDSATPTTYTRTGISSTASTTTIANPAGNTGVYTFYESTDGFFYENQHSLYTGAATGTPVEQVTTCYNPNVGPCSSVNTEFLNVTHDTARDGIDIGTDGLSFNSNGLLTSYIGLTGIITTDTYESFTGVDSIPFYRLAEQKIQTSGVTSADVDYSYDQGTLKVTSGLPQHGTASAGRGNLTSVKRLVSGSNYVTAATMTYDDAGQVQTAKDANNNTTTYGYDSTDTFATKVTRPTTNDNTNSVNVSHVSGAQYNIQSGLMTSSTDENNQTTTYTYDGMERPATISYPDGGKTTYSYTLTSVTQSVLQSGSTNLNTTVDVDGYGRTIHAYAPNGAETDTTYDADGRIDCVSNPHTSSPSSTDGNTCNSKYDGLNRVLTVTNPDSTSRQASFSGLTETLTDESGHKKQFVTDSVGRIVTVLEPDSSGALNWETDYTWSALNQLLTVTQKGDKSGNRVRTFNYDDEGRLTSQTTPEQGTTIFGYDNNGNQTSRLDARNITTTFSYDQLNRKTLETAPNIHYHYFYDIGTPSPTNAVGRLVSGSNYVNADEVYSYDPMGRLKWEASWTPSKPDNTSIIVQAQYDVAGEMTSLTYPDGRVVTNSYPSGQLNSVTYTGWNGQSENVPYLSSASYGPPGNVTAETFGNGVQVAAQNNSRLLLNSMLYKNSSQTLWSKQYTWAANGMNLTKLTDALNSANTMSYTYDPDNRVTSANATGVSETYNIDPWGNLKQSGTYTFQQNFSVNNQISATGYTYDQAGDLTKDGDGTTFTYDADGMITASGGATYVYDALDQRVAKNGGSNPEETIYFGGTAIALHNPSNGAFTDLIYANGAMIAEVAGTQTAVPVYRAGDHLGSLALQTDNSGSMTGSNTFLPFGQTLSETTADQFQFIGLPQDTENSSYHADFRNLSYEQGRWLSPDPYNGSYDLTNPQSFNRYSYVLNNPMAFIDPSGLKCVNEHFEIGQCANGGDSGDDLSYDNGFWDGFDEFGFFYNVNGGNGTYQYSSDNWDNMMQGGYGGGITDGPNNELVDPSGQVVGYLSITFVGTIGDIPTGTVSVQIGGGGGGGFGPSTGPTYSRRSVCAASALLNRGGQTALDAAGLIPFENTLVKGVQLLAAFGSAGSSIFGNSGVAEAGFSGATLSLSAVENAHVMTIGAETVPIAGSFVSLFATAYDFHQMGNNFDACMAGT